MSAYIFVCMYMCVVCKCVCARCASVCARCVSVCASDMSVCGKISRNKLLRLNFVEYVRLRQDRTTCQQAGHDDITNYDDCKEAFKDLNYAAKRTTKHEARDILFSLGIS